VVGWVGGWLSVTAGIYLLLFYFIYFIYYKVWYIYKVQKHTQTTHSTNTVESAESANSAVRCSKQTQLNCQSLISAKSYHSLKRLSAHEGLVTHAQKSSDCRYCNKPTKPILKLFRPSDSPIIEAFRTPYTDTNFQGEPLHRGV